MSLGARTCGGVIWGFVRRPRLVVSARTPVATQGPPPPLVKLLIEVRAHFLEKKAGKIGAIRG